MIGSCVIDRLRKTDKYDITIVTRNNWHWGSETRVKPYVTQYTCNRDYQPPCMAEQNAVDCDSNAIRQCPDLVQFINETSKFDYIMDFSTFHPKWINDNMEVLAGKVGLYIYISTDSVYEVCNKKPDWEKTKETDAIRPTDQAEVEKLHQANSYGHFKLAAEEALEELHKSTGLQYVSIRIADVIGARDTTERFWVHQMWLEFHDVINKPYQIPESVAKKKGSLTYVEDIATTIQLIIKKGPSCYNQAYNIAMMEEFTLSDIVLKIAEVMNIKNLETEISGEHDYYGYPTVMQGPIDMTKAIEMLDFKPSDPDVALKEIIEFYKKAFVEFPNQRDLIIQDVATFAAEDDEILMSKIFSAADKRLTAEGIVDKRFRKFTERLNELQDKEKVKEEL